MSSCMIDFSFSPCNFLLSSPLSFSFFWGAAVAWHVDFNGENDSMDEDGIGTRRFCSHSLPGSGMIGRLFSVTTLYGLLLARPPFVLLWSRRHGGRRRKKWRRNCGDTHKAVTLPRMTLGCCPCCSRGAAISSGTHMPCRSHPSSFIFLTSSRLCRAPLPKVQHLLISFTLRLSVSSLPFPFSIFFSSLLG
ncbi:hypothetical protein IWX49DRAFT_285363 [Phyllosticta citricarpa]|uniref:Uncharacterized protein n=1 Tax=Phyllosticta citricarpa TaxID=55181 RepID=A0ABR1MM19_9PEZI